MNEHAYTDDLTSSTSTAASSTDARGRIIAIDPGASGGIAVFHDETSVAYPFSKLGLRSIWELMASLEPATCYIEKVHATPQMGVTSAFKFGNSYGVLVAFAIAAGFELRYVSPQQWQRELGLTSKGRTIGQGDTAKKNTNKDAAQKLHPEIKVTHAIADALLILEYGKMQ